MINATTLSGASRAAIAASAGLALIAGFEVALALGAPWGRAAWGGGQAILPTELRVASAVAAGVWTGAALLVLARGGYLGAAGQSVLVRRATWGLFGLLLIGAALNFASSSPWERFGWAPFGLALSALTFAVARSSPSSPG
ncbi:MAG: hypothetical protein ACRDGJ_04490 [Candidatus Limnocylindria bacterium]